MIARERLLMELLDDMSIIRDVSVWEQFIPEKIKVKGGTKLTGKKTKVWRGFIEIDTNFGDGKERHKSFEALYDTYRANFAKLGPEPTIAQVHEQQDWLARELRILSGRDPLDAKEVNVVKKLDIVKLAAKFKITPGEPGWEYEIARLVEKDMHITNGEDYDTTDEE